MRRIAAISAIAGLISVMGLTPVAEAKSRHGQPTGHCVGVNPIEGKPGGIYCEYCRTKTAIAKKPEITECWFERVPATRPR